MSIVFKPVFAFMSGWQIGLIAGLAVLIVVLLIVNKKMKGG